MTGEPITIADAMECRINKEPIPLNRGFTDERVKDIAERQSDLYFKIGRLFKEIEGLDDKLRRISKGSLE